MGKRHGHGTLRTAVQAAAAIAAAAVARRAAALRTRLQARRHRERQRSHYDGTCTEGGAYSNLSKPDLFSDGGESDVVGAPITTAPTGASTVPGAASAIWLMSWAGCKKALGVASCALRGARRAEGLCCTGVAIRKLSALVAIILTAVEGVQSKTAAETGRKMGGFGGIAWVPDTKRKRLAWAHLSKLAAPTIGMFQGHAHA